MQKLILTLLLSTTFGWAIAQSDPPTMDTIPTMDTMVIQTDSVFADAYFSNRFLWIDTLGCKSDEVIRELPDSIYKLRLASLPYIVEMPYHPIVRNYITRYLKYDRKLSQLRSRAEYYFPLMEDMLARYELPYELCYLAVIESALNPTARSHMGAAGIWQFMPSTGKKYGLEINSLVDERMDPVKSTQAACLFLKDLYHIYGNWNLVIASYNCGPGTVNKAIHRSGGKKDFWTLYDFLPKETRSYLPLFIAAAYAMNFAGDHGVCQISNGSLDVDTILTQDRLHLKQISEVLQIDINVLRRLNPQYTQDIVPGGDKAYSLCLPIEKSGLYVDHVDSIHNFQADRLIHNRRKEIDMALRTGVSGGYMVNGVQMYKVKKGDSLSAIAKRFHVSVKQLKNWNHLSDDFLKIGKTLRVGA